jgi:ribosomal protein S18 acetylase RimI-like enzyme
MIVLKKIFLRDFLLLYKWVNNKESARLTRKFSKTTFIAHTKWFLKSYKSNQHQIFKIQNLDSHDDIGLVQIIIFNLTAELRIKIISSNLRGKGFGSQALEQLIEKVRSMELLSVYLFVRRDNQTAINLYRKYGFEFVPDSDFMIEYSEGFFLTSKMSLRLR